MALVFLAVCVYLAAVVETTVTSRWEIRGATPDLLVMMAFIWLTARSQRRSLLPVALVGLASDLGSATPLGLGLATFALAGYAVVRLKPRLDTHRIGWRLLVIWSAATSVALVQAISLIWLAESREPLKLLVERCFITGLYTVGVAAPLLMIAGWFEKRDSIELQSAYV